MRHIGMVSSVVGVLLAGAGLAEADLRQAQLSGVTGQVEWLQAGSDTWQPIPLQQMLSSGDKVRTGQGSKAVLSLDEGSTIELDPGSEFSIQTLTGDPSAQSESLFSIQQGKLTAIVTPVLEGSLFQIQTSSVLVNVPAGGADPSLTITISPDGSVEVGSTDGVIELVSVGPDAMTATLSTGDVALVTIDPATGAVTVTSLAGTFDVIGPDGAPITLASGDSVTFSGGAATFVEGEPPGVDAPAFDALVEPASGS